MVDARRVILGFLQAAARSKRLRAAARHVAASAFVLSLLLSASLLAVLALPAARSWLLLGLACVVLCGAGLLVGIILRSTRPAATATWIARREPGLGTALADAVEFEDALAASGPATGSADLARAHVRQVADRASQDDPVRLARAAVPRLHFGRAAVAVGVAVLLWTTLPDARRVLLLGPIAVTGDVVGYSDVEVTYRYPAYLDRPQRVEVGTGDVQAPTGTHVTLRLRADHSLTSARLDAPGGITEMGVAGDTATGQLVVTKDGEWRAILDSEDGRRDPDPPRHVIRAQADEPPEVRIRLPENDEVQLVPGGALDLRWTATDDHGVAEVVLVRSDAGSEAPAAGAPAGAGVVRTSLGTFDPPTPQRSGDRAVALRDLEVTADHAVLVWLEARDDDEVSGPKWVASRRIRVTLGTARQQEEEIAAGSEEVAERLLALLAGHLVSSPDRLRDAAALMTHHEELTRGLLSVLDVLAPVLDGMQDQGEDLVATTALEQLRGRIEWMVRARQRRVADAAGSNERLRDAFAALHPPEIEELERDVLFFDMWADRRASLRASDATADLLEAIHRLQAQLASAGEEITPEVSSAAEELESMAAEVAPLLEELAASADDPEGAAEAKEALEQLRQALERLSRSAKAGDRASTRETAGSAERRARDLDDLVQDMARSGGMGDPELAKEIEQAHAEIKRLRREQVDLRDKTNAMRDEARESMSPESRKRVDELFAELLQLAEQAVAAEASGEEILGRAPEVSRWFERVEERARLETRLAQIDEELRAGGAADESEREKLRDRHRAIARLESSGDGEMVESLMRLSQASREALGRLRQVLADRQIDAAHAPARWSLSALELLVDDLSHEESPGLDAGKPPFQTAMARTSEILSRLDELERQVEQATQSTLTSSQRQEMGQLARAQGELVDQARKLAARLREAGADAPFLDDEVAGAVDKAGEHMDGAAGRLHDTRPGEASEEQGEAMAQLDEAAKAMSPGSERGGQRPGGKPGGRGREGRSGRDGRNGREDSRGATSREEVDIPDADDYRVPKEFREEILEAMREASAPEGYEEQVREYYRRLVE